MIRRAFLKGGAASVLMCACCEQALPQTAAKRKHFCGFKPSAFRAYSLKDIARRNWSLTWKFTGTVLGAAPRPGAPRPTINVSSVLNDAFALWHNAVPRLAFKELTGPSTVDINVTVANLGGPDAKGDLTLASTKADGSGIEINNQVNTFGRDNAMLGRAEDSLLSVLAHEIGHALGLLHATTESSLMFAYSGNQERLGSDDVAGIKGLYGWAPVAPIGFGTDGTPAIVDCDGTLAMVWRGQGSNHNLWISTSTDGKKWAPQRIFSDVGTFGNPGLAWDDGQKRLWMVWRGVGDDKNSLLQDKHGLLCEGQSGPNKHQRLRLHARPAHRHHQRDADDGLERRER